MPDTLLTALSGLAAQQRAMEVTSHNLANATTPGYTRQRVSLQASLPEDAKPGQFGRGVDLTAVRRIMDVLVNERVRQAEGESGRLADLKSNLMVVQQAFNEPGDNGVSAVIGRLFSSFEDLSNNPESVAIRSTVVQQAQTFTATLSDLGKRLTNIRDDLKISLTSNIAKVNDLTASIAVLNQQIRTQVNQGASPNDLMDRRDSQLAELTGLLDVKVRTDPRDQSVAVDLGGRLLVGTADADVLKVTTTSDGNIAVVGSSGIAYDLAGGSIGALADLHRNIITGVSGSLDELASSMAHAMNAIHATGTSNSLFANSFTSDYSIATLQAGLNLDDPALVSSAQGQPGLAKAFLPSFANSTGVQIPQDLTINVLDSTTKLATKYTLRWDPAQNNGSRSLDDLITAINTGVGGGWTLYPPTANGVQGVSAQKIQVDGGVKLQLLASDPKTSIDFSTALDLQPTRSAWTGTGTVAVSGTAAPALPTRRLDLGVNASGSSLELSYRDALSGSKISLGSVAIPAPASPNNSVTINGITVNVAAGSFRAGDHLAVNLNLTGDVQDPATNATGTQTITASWSATDAAITFGGRYTNTLSDPTHQWSAKIITPGIVGNKSTLAAPNNPPVVQFTFWTGTPAAPVQQVITRTLDENLPAGTPIALADGVYAKVGTGSLTTTGNQVNVIVDGQPDQAGILPALGINSLFKTGELASTIAVADRVVKDPSQLGLSKTRSEGDNSNLKDLLDVRKQKLFKSGAFTLDDFYQGMLTDVGVRIQQADRMATNQDALKASLNQQRESLSGVSIDEEVGRLIQQQQAYSAAAKIVSAARENIQTLLEILR